MAEEARVPEIDQRQQHRQVALERRLAEMLIEAGGAGEQFREHFPAVAYGDGQADRRPEGKASTDPVPDRQHVGTGDAKGARRLDVAGHCDKMRGQRTSRAKRACEPGPRLLRVGHRLGSGEGFRGDDEHRRRRVQAGERTTEVFGVDIGDKTHVHAFAAARPWAAQSVADQARSEVGATDADGHDATQGPSGCSDAHAATDQRCQRAHALLRCADFGNDVLAVDIHCVVVLLSQCGVQHRPRFRQVDFFASEQRRDPRRKIALVREGDEQLHRLRSQPLL